MTFSIESEAKCSSFKCQCAVENVALYPGKINMERKDGGLEDDVHLVGGFNPSEKY